MAEPISSVLLVDYEKLQQSFAAAGGEGQFADRAAIWLAAVADGRAFEPKGISRRLVIKRCYAGPGVNGKLRDRLHAAGFDVVEAGDGTRGSSDLHMAMDTIEALSRPEGFGEFILLSPGTELAPLLTRLKAAKRTAVILADDTTSARDRTMADVVIEAKDLVRPPAPGEPVAAIEARAPAAAPVPDRADIEAFARRIHAATNIPLLSPKTFAELFRHLTDEVAASGYHFQTTAKNVADRMSASGRNVTRRQVVFIVKGLALKGHVFSTGDTSDRLAEVFREQARYLISNAGITLDPREEQLLVAWFQGRPTAAAPRAAAAPATAPVQPAAPAAPATPPAAQAPPASPSAETRARIAETIEREVAKAVVRPSAKPPQPRPAVGNQQRPPPVRPVEMPKSTARSAQPVRPAPTAREEAKAVIAARIAASAKIKKTARPTLSQTPVPANNAPSTTPPEPPFADETHPAPHAHSHNGAASPDMIETSILAAIAEAVDVLVDEPEARSREERPAPQPRAQDKPAPEEEPDAPTEIDDAESGDIGDQIQRIIASYNRSRLNE